MAFILETVFALLSYRLQDPELDRRHWKSSDEGYIYHVISASMEWIFVLLLSPFFCTFIPEMRKIKFCNGRIRYDLVRIFGIKTIKNPALKAIAPGLIIIDGKGFNKNVKEHSNNSNANDVIL